MVRSPAEPGGARGSIRESLREPDATILRAVSKDVAVVVDPFETRQIVDEMTTPKECNRSPVQSEDRGRDDVDDRDGHGKDNNGSIAPIIDLTDRDGAPENPTSSLPAAQSAGQSTPDSALNSSWMNIFDWPALGGVSPASDITGDKKQRLEQREKVNLNTQEAVETIKVQTVEVEKIEVEVVEESAKRPAILVETVVEEEQDVNVIVVHGVNEDDVQKDEPEATVHVVTSPEQDISIQTSPVLTVVIPQGELFQPEPGSPPRKFVSEEFLEDSVPNTVVQPTTPKIASPTNTKRASKSHVAGISLVDNEEEDVDDKDEFGKGTEDTFEAFVSKSDYDVIVQESKAEKVQSESTESLVSVIKSSDNARFAPVDGALKRNEGSIRLTLDENPEDRVSDCGCNCFASPEVLLDDGESGESIRDLQPDVPEVDQATDTCEKDDAPTPEDIATRQSKQNEILETEHNEEGGTMASPSRSFLSTIFACVDPAPTLDEQEKAKQSVGETSNADTKPSLSPLRSTVRVTQEPDGVKSRVSPKSDESKEAAILEDEGDKLNGDVNENDDGDDKANNIDEVEGSDDADGGDGGDGSPDDKCLLDMDDLVSIPSVLEDVAESVGPMKAEDLGSPNSPHANSAALVEHKMKQLEDTMSVASTLTKTTVVSEAVKLPPSSFESKRRRLLLKELRSAIATFGRYDIRCANISAALGDLLDEAGEFDRAIKYHRDAVTIYSCKLGDDHLTTIEAKVRCGKVLENAGQVEEAINFYYQVTVMRRALKGDQDPSVADGLVCMAHALRKKGDYVQAIKELKRALKVYRESLGDSDKKVASTVDEIASLYVTIGDFGKASAILEEIVKLKAATMGSKSPAVATTLGHLATSYECSENFTAAMKALKKSYKIYTEISGYSSEDATGTLNRMAQLYESTSDHNRAAVAYLGVLRARKIQRGADHLTVGETYFRLGHALRATKQHDKALKCLKEALPIFVGQGVEMDDVEMVADIMHEMALVNHDRRHFDDAARIFKQELNVRRKIGQPSFPFIAKTLKHLGITEYSLKNYSRSLKCFVEALAIHQERGEAGVECGEIFYHTGLASSKLENPERAMKGFTEATRIFTEHGCEEHDFSLLRDANEKIRLLHQENAKK